MTSTAVGSALPGGPAVSGFVYRKTAGHARVKFSDGKWGPVEFVEEDQVTIPIMANVLHYGQAIFEGLKAFQCKSGKVCIFNDFENFKRINASAHRMCMPAIPPEVFFKAVDVSLEGNLAFLPPYGTGQAMYIRPVMFGSGDSLMPFPANEYYLLVICIPVGTYYKKGAAVTGVEAAVIDDFDRAAPQGVGACKCAGNYAADMYPARMYKEQGFPASLYLDAKEKRYVEEFNTSNFVGITKDGRYVTPKSDSVLPSCTNKMLQVLAKEKGMSVEIRPIDFEKEVEDFAEVGAVGTAVVVTPIKSFVRTSTGKKFECGNADAPVLRSLKERLEAIQLQESEDTYGWVREMGKLPRTLAPNGAEAISSNGIPH
uniref:Branched-chain-amino-acid transaminase n=1 Tax=Chromera velia CCMP2878 TaxID=1169474 RepID=A0A0G4HPH0_9ALVE|eukprot:Cvel_7798.t1-p1 / transcript=Cvel_7798.t1 / gene=Cvel_7798 / organism=Chromera_velia_CCMP2878 / gene_product=Branched-chain-amino-acid aminotransferase, putative / transcript_product=Branched-chain-amino-acid aminotransferase, putative / location=Cvel_scaffold416:6-11217(-) / protein_length=370 / sequence_SO=supercontig / SO=protein_coding / is_pseudo=false